MDFDSQIKFTTEFYPEWKEYLKTQEDKILLSGSAAYYCMHFIDRKEWYKHLYPYELDIIGVWERDGDE